MGVNCLIQIGNSDDRLTQQQWADFIIDMRGLLAEEWRGRLQIHGEWFSGPDQPWQNANWCIEVLPPSWWQKIHGEPPTPEERAFPELRHRNNQVAELSRNREMESMRRDLKHAVRHLCFRYNQDSFAWTTGTVELVETGYVEKQLRQREDMLRMLRVGTVEEKEGWLPERVKSPYSVYLNDEDRRRITGTLERNRREQSTPGEVEGSTPSTPAPASTGAGEALTDCDNWRDEGAQDGEGVAHCANCGYHFEDHAEAARSPWVSPADAIDSPADVIRGDT